MSNEKELTTQEETQRLMDIISDIEEKIRVSSEENLNAKVVLSDTETIALDRAKLRLSELEKADAKELQRIINDSIEAGEGFFPKEKFKEIKEE